MTIEAIVRPFQTENTFPTPFTEENQPGAPPVRIAVGIRGGTKTFAYSGSYTVTTYMMAVHKETNVSTFDYKTGKTA